MADTKANQKATRYGFELLLAAVLSADMLLAAPAELGWGADVKLNLAAVDRNLQGLDHTCLGLQGCCLGNQAGAPPGSRRHVAAGMLQTEGGCLHGILRVRMGLLASANVKSKSPT